MKIKIASRLGFGLAVLGMGYLLENDQNHQITTRIESGRHMASPCLIPNAS